MKPNMLDRCSYDLGHFTIQCGAIGALQTLSLIPVCAGDSFEIDFNGVFRLSPLRRNPLIVTGKRPRS